MNCIPNKYTPKKQVEKQEFKNELASLTDNKLKQIIQNIHDNNNYFNMSKKINLDPYTTYASRLKKNLSELYSLLEKNPVSLSDSLITGISEAQKNINQYTFDISIRQPVIFDSQDIICRDSSFRKETYARHIPLEISNSDSFMNKKKL